MRGRLVAAVHRMLDAPLDGTALAVACVATMLLVFGGAVGHHAWQDAHAAPPAPAAPQHRIDLEVYANRGIPPTIECVWKTGPCPPPPPTYVPPTLPLTGDLIVSTPAGWDPATGATLPWSRSLTTTRTGAIDIKASIPDAATTWCTVTVDGQQVASEVREGGALECQAEVH